MADRIRLRVLPSLLPQNLELENTGTEVRYRYAGQGDDAWITLFEIEDISATLEIGTVSTLGPNDVATVENVGTPQHAILNIGIPAGSDGLVQTITPGDGIAVDTTDPNNPTVSLDIDLITPQMFGAVGDNSTDDYEALQDFFDALAAGGKYGFIPPASYRLATGLVITGVDYSVSAVGARLVPDSGVLVGVQLGTTAAILGNVKIDGLCVDRAAYSGATENIGILIKNVANATFIDLFARESKYNFKIAPEEDDRVGYNTFINARAFNGYYNIWYTPSGDGWANENHWFGGRYQCSADTVYNLRVDGQISSNENKFISMSLEGGGATLAAIYCDGHANIFEYPRLEGTWASGAAVIFGTLSVRNYISSQRFDENVIDRGTGNVINCAAIRKTNISVNGRNTQRFLRSAGSAQTAFSSAPTATTTANSATVTFSSTAELAAGNVITIPGSITNGRIEYLDPDGVTGVLDRPAAPAVSGVTVLRELTSVVDISDAGTASGDNYLLALNAGRTGTTTKLIWAAARGVDRFTVDGNGNLTNTGSIVVGSPTGGSKGNGTVNAVGVYDDNTLLTCYPIEAALTGKVDAAFWDAVSANGEHAPARRFASERMHLLDVDAFIAAWRSQGHLPTLPSRDEWKRHAEDAQSMGAIIQMLWETVDVMAVHMAQMRDEQKAR